MVRKQKAKAKVYTKQDLERALQEKAQLESQKDQARKNRLANVQKRIQDIQKYLKDNPSTPSQKSNQMAANSQQSSGRGTPKNLNIKVNAGDNIGTSATNQLPVNQHMPLNNQQPIAQQQASSNQNNLNTLQAAQANIQVPDPFALSNQNNQNTLQAAQVNIHAPNQFALSNQNNQNTFQAVQTNIQMHAPLSIPPIVFNNASASMNPPNFVQTANSNSNSIQNSLNANNQPQQGFQSISNNNLAQNQNQTILQVQKLHTDDADKEIEHLHQISRPQTAQRSQIFHNDFQPLQKRPPGTSIQLESGLKKKVEAALERISKSQAKDAQKEFMSVMKKIFYLPKLHGMVKRDYHQIQLGAQAILKGESMRRFMIPVVVTITGSQHYNAMQKLNLSPQEIDIRLNKLDQSLKNPPENFKLMSGAKFCRQQINEIIQAECGGHTAFQTLTEAPYTLLLARYYDPNNVRRLYTDEYVKGTSQFDLVKKQVYGDALKEDLMALSKHVTGKKGSELSGIEKFVNITSKDAQFESTSSRGIFDAGVFQRTLREYIRRLIYFDKIKKCDQLTIYQTYNDAKKLYSTLDFAARHGGAYQNRAINAVKECNAFLQPNGVVPCHDLLKFIASADPERFSTIVPEYSFTQLNSKCVPSLSFTFQRDRHLCIQSLYELPEDKRSQRCELYLVGGKIAASNFYSQFYQAAKQSVGMGNKDHFFIVAFFAQKDMKLFNPINKAINSLFNVHEKDLPGFNETEWLAGIEIKCSKIAGSKAYLEAFPTYTANTEAHTMLFDMDKNGLYYDGGQDAKEIKELVLLQYGDELDESVAGGIDMYDQNDIAQDIFENELEDDDSQQKDDNDSQDAISQGSNKSDINAALQKMIANNQQQQGISGGPSPEPSITSQKIPSKKQTPARLVQPQLQPQQQSYFQPQIQPQNSFLQPQNTFALQTTTQPNLQSNQQAFGNLPSANNNSGTGQFLQQNPPNRPRTLFGSNVQLASNVVRAGPQNQPTRQLVNTKPFQTLPANYAQQDPQQQQAYQTPSSQLMTSGQYGSGYKGPQDNTQYLTMGLQPGPINRGGFQSGYNHWANQPGPQQLVSNDPYSRQQPILPQNMAQYGQQKMPQQFSQQPYQPYQPHQSRQRSQGGHYYQPQQ